MASRDYSQGMIQTLLSKSELAEKYGDQICSDIARIGEVRSVAKQSMLFQEGEEVAGIWVIISGVMKLNRYTPEGREIILHLVEPCQLFAEAAIFLGKYPATAVAVEDTTVVLIRKDKVLELMNSHPDFLKMIFSTMANWLQRMLDKVDQLTLNDATARVSRYILALQSDHQNSDGSLPSALHFPVKKGELALMLNMNQATFSRALRRLQDEEILSVQSREIELLNQKRLKKLSMPPLD